MAKKVKITFWGGTELVTGANFLIDDGAGLKMLVDCGMFQGNKLCDDKNREPFPYDPASIQVLFITHAHLDHIGRIPKLVHDGFRGKIYSTEPTRDIAQFAMVDSLGVLEKESRYDNKPPIFDEKDIDQAMSQWETIGYHEPITVGDFKIVFRDAGHILGSSMVEFMYHSANGSSKQKLIFTGDLGNSPAPLVRDSEVLTDATYLVMESVYGDRNHENRGERRNKLEDVIEETMKSGGTLLIPAFSIERTQELLFEIENMMEQSRIPLVPVFLDSPLGIKITSVYKRFPEYLNQEADSINRLGDGILKFPQLQMTLSTEESKAISSANPRKIIIAGSGMSMGGRIVHHEKHHLSNPNNTLLLIGYQAPGSLGRLLQEGVKHVKILGDEVEVRARIESISGYSAHKDSDALLEFVRSTADTLKAVYVVMGEPKSSLFLVQRIRDYLGVNAVAPSEGQTVEVVLDEVVSREEGPTRV